MFAVGSRVDRFELTAKLGQGGQGSVWSARDLVDGSTRALKLVPLLGVKEATRERMRREARTLSTIAHPGVVRCHGLFERFEPGVLGIVLELVQGRSLEQSLDDPRLDRAHRELVLEHLADALAHLHERGLVHRDLKPANVMLSADFWAAPRAPGSVKLVDFGIATHEHDDRRITEAGHFIGTVPYVPPESMDPRLFPGSALSPRVDVFALGVLASVLLSGRHPTGLPMNASAVEFLGAYRAGQLATPPEAVVPRVLSACWDPAAERRPATAAEVLRALRAVTTPSATAGPRTEPTPPPGSATTAAAPGPEATVPASPLHASPPQVPARGASRGVWPWVLLVGVPFALAGFIVVLGALAGSVWLARRAVTRAPRSPGAAPEPTPTPAAPTPPTTQVPTVTPPARQEATCCSPRRSGDCFQKRDHPSCEQPLRGRVRLRLYRAVTPQGSLQVIHPNAAVELRGARHSALVPLANQPRCGASKSLVVDASELTAGITVTVMDGSAKLYRALAKHDTAVKQSAICEGLVFDGKHLAPSSGPSSYAVTRLEFVVDPL